MDIKTTTNIDIDFCDKKYVLVNAKQLDRNSRFLSVTCYNQGELFYLNSGDHAAYVRYRKADDYGVFNNCDIDRFGKIIVELTEQMLAADGICYADLVVVNKGEAVVDPNTGEIDEKIENASVLSTMTFCIDVSEVPVTNAEIESTHEFILLNDKIEKYWADFEDVMKTSKSWAVGNTGIRDGENTNNSEYYSLLSKSYAVGDADGARVNEDSDNAKYYSEQSSNSASNANESEINAKSYMETTNEYMNTTNEYMVVANEHRVNAHEHMYNASVSEQNAKTYMDNALVSEQNAKSSEVNADVSESNAKASETNALTSEQNAKASETNALNSANRAQSYAVGGTGTRDGEDSNNSYYYYEKVRNIISGLENGFIPMGTISFSELATVDKLTGYVYNIRDDFTTDESFAEGSGKSYTSGVNVYCRSDGLWDCFGGATPPTATVDEVKYYLGI